MLSTADRNRALTAPCLLLLLGAILLFRIPMLLNPEISMISDHAFLGLQALRIFHGEWSWLLWGSDYQASWEPFLAAGYFAVFGKTYAVLQWVPMTAFLITVCATYFLLLRYLKLSVTLAFLSLWVLSSHPFLSVNLLPYRMWSILFVLLPLWVLERPHTSKGLWFVMGLLPFWALFVDLFTINFLPAICFYTLWKAKEEKYLGQVVPAILLGALSYAAFRALGPKTGGPLAFSPKVFLNNIPLFFKQCLPILCGFDYPGADGLSWADPIRVVAYVSTVLLLVLGMGSLGFFFKKNLSVAERRMAVTGSGILWVSLLGFWGSSMASDIHSVRYLQTPLYALPLALIPYARMGFGKLVSILVVVAALTIGYGGWRQMAPMTDGSQVLRDPQKFVATSKELSSWMLAHGVEGGFSDYWTSYQLSFLFLEKPLIVPRNFPDRYKIYRDKVLSLPVVAEVFTPKDPAKDAVEMEAQLKKQGIFLDRWEKNGFTVFLRKNT